jgi:hypothetical protein
MKFKTLFLSLIILLLLHNSANAQDKYPLRFGVQASYGKTGYAPWGSDGVPSYKGRYFLDIGFLILKPISDKWEFETGLVYSNNQFKVRPNTPPGLNPTYNDAINYLIIPANFRLWLAHKFLLQAGPNLTFPIDESGGSFRLGFSLGFGKEFKVGEKFAILIVPTFNANPFFPTNRDSMTQLGIRTIFAFPTKQ